MSHTVHEPISTHGLADDCERCAEHAEHPLRSLDNQNLREILWRIVNNEKPRSQAETRAMDNVEEAMYAAGQIASCEPQALTMYIAGKWGIDLGGALS